MKLHPALAGAKSTGPDVSALAIVGVVITLLWYYGLKAWRAHTRPTSQR
jgi:hypothetical protein